MEPIACPRCGEAPVTFPECNFGSYSCRAGHEFHRCAEHRHGVFGASPLRDSKLLVPMCTCGERLGAHQCCQACHSVLLHPVMTRHEGLAVRCQSCGHVAHLCAAHNTWVRGGNMHTQGNRCSCHVHRKKPVLKLSRAVIPATRD